MKKVHEILRDIYNISWSNLNILECGASNEGSETEVFEQNNNCWFIEANVEDFNHLKNIRRNVLNVALSDKNDIVKFKISSHPGNSSCDYSFEHLKELESYGTTFKEVEVDSITYESLLKKIDVVFDVLVLDIEGHEKKVLESFKQIQSINLPTILVIECGYDWYDRLEILEQLGYKVDCYYFNNCYLSKKNLELYKENVQRYNKEWKSFIWFDKIIYKNHLSDDTGL